jgi:3-hydroxyacyl-[acyl-carrier-protein] dehydratase
MSIAGKDIVHQLIPQKVPFVMVDSLRKWEEKHCLSGFTVAADNILLDGSHLSEAAMMENIAQTSALHSAYGAYLLRKSNGDASAQMPVSIGFIGAITQFKLFHLPTLGDELETEVIITHQIGPASVIEGFVRVGEKLMAQCHMKIFRQ